MRRRKYYSHFSPYKELKIDSQLVLTFEKIGTYGIEKFINGYIELIHEKIENYENLSDSNARKLRLYCEFINTILEENKNKIDINDIYIDLLDESITALDDIL